MDFYDEIKGVFLENKKLIIISSLIFFIPLIISFIFSDYVAYFFQPVASGLSKDIKSGVLEFNFLTIFLNNISILIKEYFMGLFLFIATVYILVYNGMFLGYYFASSNNLFKSIVLILPHGIFEFSAIILSASGGFLLCLFILHLIYTIIYPKKDKLSLSDRLDNSIEEHYKKFKHSIILFIISIILIAIAGFIEVYLTIPIGNFILR